MMNVLFSVAMLADVNLSRNIVLSQNALNLHYVFLLGRGNMSNPSSLFACCLSDKGAFIGNVLMHIKILLVPLNLQAWKTHTQYNYSYTV